MGGCARRCSKRDGVGLFSTSDTAAARLAFARLRRRSPLDFPRTSSAATFTLSVRGPAFDQLVTMSKFLRLRMELIDVIRASTAAHSSSASPHRYRKAANRWGRRWYRARAAG